MRKHCMRDVIIKTRNGGLVFVPQPELFIILLLLSLRLLRDATSHIFFTVLTDCRALSHTRRSHDVKIWLRLIFFSCSSLKAKALGLTIICQNESSRTHKWSLIHIVFFDSPTMNEHWTDRSEGNLSFSLFLKLDIVTNWVKTTWLTWLRGADRHESAVWYFS